MQKEKYSRYILLFIFTFITCLIAGAQWQNKNFTEILNWKYGLTYTYLSLLSFRLTNLAITLPLAIMELKQHYLILSHSHFQ